MKLFEYAQCGDDENEQWTNVYAVPDDTPEEVTEGEAEAVALDWWTE